MSMDDIARRIGFKSYVEYLRGGHWQHMVAVHRNSKCFCCNETESLQLHHNTYEHLGRELPTDLVTVCRACHERIHGIVSSRLASLENAHIVLKKKIQKFGNAKKSRPSIKWATNWRKLINRSKHQTLTELETFLMSKGLLSREYGAPSPTELAFSRGFAMISQDGRSFWNRKLYIEMMRADKKLAKCHAKGERPHPAILKRALAK